MSPGHCSCPDCGTPLRIRDRSFIGRQVECPECQAKLTISLDADRNPIAERPQKTETKKVAPAKIVAPVVKAGSSVGQKLGDIVRSPLAIAWALGICVTAFVAIMMLRPNVRFRTSPEKPSAASMAKQEDSPATANDQKSPTALENPAAPQTDPVAESQPSTNEKPVEIPTDNVANEIETKGEPRVDLKGAAPASDKVPNANPKVENPKPVVVAVKVQVEELFKQPIKGFATTRPLSRKELIELVEEMLGAPIRYRREELGEMNLERTMSISLEATTVGGVLKVLLESAGWDYVIEDDGIRLKPRRVADNNPSQ